MGRVHALLRLGRVSLLPTVVGDVLAGFALASAQGSRPSPTAAVLATTAQTLLFVGGMALNDWADRDKDRLIRPDRPLPSGILRPAHASALAASSLLLAVALALCVSGRYAVAAAVLVLLVLLYDLAPGHAGALGPPVLGLLRAGDVLAASAAAGADLGDLVPALAPTFVYVTALSVLARREDEEVPFERRDALATLLAVAAALCALPFLVPGGATDRLGAAVLVALLALSARSSAAPLLSRDRPPGAAAVRRLVGALLGRILLLDAALAFGSGRPDLALPLLLLWPLSRWARRRIPPT